MRTGQSLPNHSSTCRARAAARAFADIRFERGVLNVRLIGPSVSQREAPIIARALTAEIAEVGSHLERLVIDAAEIRLLSSLGLGVCIDARNAAAQVGAETVICGLGPDMRQLFRLTKVDRLFRFAGTGFGQGRSRAA